VTSPSDDTIALSEMNMAAIAWSYPRSYPGVQHGLPFIKKAGSSVQFKNSLVDEVAE